MVQNNIDLDTEKTVLGCLICDFQNCKGYEELTTDDFTDTSNKLLFKGILNIIGESKPLDPVIVMTRVPVLKDHIIDITENFITSTNLEHYIEELRKLTFNRDYLKLLKKAEHESNIETSKSLDNLLTGLNALGDRSNNKRDFKTILKEHFNNLEKKDLRRYYKTGFPTLDKMTKGIKPDLTVIAARPSMGKTALALNIVSNVIKQKGRVLIFSLEMNTESLLNRMLAQNLSINLTNRVEEHNFYDTDWPKIAKFYGEISESNLVVFDNVFDINSIITKSYNYSVANKGVDLIVIDYLQLIHTENSKESRDREIGILTGTLKALTIKLDCCVLALAQLNRKLEERTNKRPMLSDLRESGAIEQDADKVIMLHREGYYTPDKDNTDEAELLLRKHRSGPTGCIDLKWFGQYTSFKELINE